MALGIRTLGTALSRASSSLYRNTGLHTFKVGVKDSAKLARDVFNPSNIHGAMRGAGAVGGAYGGAVVAEAAGATNVIHKTAAALAGGAAGWYATSGLKGFASSLSKNIGNTLVKFM
jgi:hypothetical protein